MTFHLKPRNIPIPIGLNEILREIACEVLRYEPKNISAFIADYLELKVLTTQENNLFLQNGTILKLE